jgi:hypothetical protein
VEKLFHSIIIVRSTFPCNTASEEANDTLTSMHSMATTSSNQGKKGEQSVYMATNDEEYLSYVEEQRRLLEMDDIIDDEDENSLASNQKTNQLLKSRKQLQHSEVDDILS